MVSFLKKNDKQKTAADQRKSAKQMRDSSDTMRRKDSERRALVAAKREMAKPRIAKSAREDSGKLASE